MTRLRTLSTAVAWTAWSPAAFERARRERKPVLLSIAAEWCGSCREMDRTTYADPTIVTAINERFVPVRVDAEQRPDVSERYSLGGWPTTAFLTPAGEILGGGTYVPVDRMLHVLDQVGAAFDPEGSVIQPPDTSVPPATNSTRGGAGPPWDALVAHAFEDFDPVHGGFGGAPKFPLVAPLRLALLLSQENADPRWELILVTSLDAMGWGGLYDEAQGGFFHYAVAADWQDPHTEKLLEPNAALMRLYLDAGSALGLTRFSERGADVLRFIQTWLAEPVDGGWFASQHADAAYYATLPEAREVAAAPPVSRVQYADGNAAMASAALHAAAIFGDDGLRDFGLKCLERVLLACYKPGHGVGHCHDGRPGVRGLLTDQVAMAGACLDAHTLSGNIVYEMMAEELMHFAVRTMWNERDGGFFDRAEDADGADIGLMRTRLIPFVLNCEAAQVLHRLAASSGEHDFARLATETLHHMGSIAHAQGPLAAHYVLAARDVQTR